MRITLTDYGEHGKVTYFGEEAAKKIAETFEPLPDHVTKRVVTFEREPPFPKLSRDT